MNNFIDWMIYLMFEKEKEIVGSSFFESRKNFRFFNEVEFH